MVNEPFVVAIEDLADVTDEDRCREAEGEAAAPFMPVEAIVIALAERN